LGVVIVDVVVVLFNILFYIFKRGNSFVLKKTVRKNGEQQSSKFVFSRFFVRTSFINYIAIAG